MATISRVTAALLLLLSTGLLNNAQGSFPSPDDKAVFPDFDFESIRGQFEKVRAQTLKDVSPASAGTAANVGRPGGVQARPDIPVAHLTPLSEAVQGSALNTNSRILQEGGCSDADTSISVSSTVFPLLEGCLSPVVTDSSSGYGSSTATILRVPALDSSDTTIWAAAYADSSGEVILACLSVGNADLMDPSEVAWYCDTDGGGLEFLLADDELSVSCGCEVTSPSPMVTDAPAPSTTVSACGDGDSFSIVSETLPVTEGCYLGTGFASNDQVLYTTSGTSDFGQIWVVANQVSGAGSSTSGNVHWFIVDVAASGENADSDFFCSSAEEAALYHPWEVPTWRCIEGVTIDVACGCSGSPSPTPPSPVPSPISPRTPAPVAQPIPQPSAEPTSISAPSPASETLVNTCPGDGSFTIMANAAPELSGCFLASTSTDGLLVYTVSGTSTLSEVVVVSLENDGGDVFWFIGFVSLSDDSGGETQLYCSSQETADSVNPGDATWGCDFTGSGDNLLATEDDISIACGSCDTIGATSQPASSPVSPPTPTQLTPPAPPTAQPATSFPPPSTPSPVAAPITPVSETPAPLPASPGGPLMVADTCSGDGSFTIAANAAPNLDGCFKGTGSSTQTYTVSGTETQNEVFVFAIETEAGNFKWVIGFVSIDDDDEDRRVYCVSAETASDVHPGNASWNCDFTGNNGNVLAASEDDISISCGACAETVAPGDAQGSSQASKLGVGVVAAGGVSMVAVASVFADWC